MRQAKPELTITVIEPGKRGRAKLPQNRISDLEGYMSTSSANFLAEALRPEQGRSDMTFSLRKEVIQPQVLLQLPCYDFTPITDSTFGRCVPCGFAHGLRVFPAFVV